MGKKMARLEARITKLEEALADLLRGALNHPIKVKKKAKKSIAKKAAPKKAAARQVKKPAPPKKSPAPRDVAAISAVRTPVPAPAPRPLPAAVARP